MRRARRVGGVDAERRTRRTAAAELPEAVEEQRATVATASPRPAHAKRTDVAAAHAHLVPRDRRDLVAVADEEPERRVVVRALLLTLPPGLEGLRMWLPVILERFL